MSNFRGIWIALVTPFRSGQSAPFKAWPKSSSLTV